MDDVTLFTFFEKLFPELVLLCWLVQQGLLGGAAPTPFTSYAAAVLAGLDWTVEGQAAAVGAAEQAEKAAEAEKKRVTAARAAKRAARVANERYSAAEVLELLVLATSNRPTWASVAEHVLWQMRDPKQSKRQTLEDVVAKLGLPSPRALLDRLVAAARDAAVGDTVDEVSNSVYAAVSTVMICDESVCGYALGKLVQRTVLTFDMLDPEERTVYSKMVRSVLHCSKKALQSYGEKSVTGAELLGGFDAVAARVGAHVADAARSAAEMKMPEQASRRLAAFGEVASELAAAGGLWGLAAISDILQAVDSSARSPAAAEAAAGAARAAGLE